MSAPQATVDVMASVLTPEALTRAAVNLDMFWEVMHTPVMVSLSNSKANIRNNHNRLPRCERVFHK